MKGWLTATGIPFEKTHDIRRLIKQASVALPDFNRFTAAAEVLTPYVSAFRYPGLSDDPMPSREEFDEALKHAQAIYDFVLNLLPAEARPVVSASPWEPIELFRRSGVHRDNGV